MLIKLSKPCNDSLFSRYARRSPYPLEWKQFHDLIKTIGSLNTHGFFLVTVFNIDPHEIAGQYREDQRIIGKDPIQVRARTNTSQGQRSPKKILVWSSVLKINSKLFPSSSETLMPMDPFDSSLLFSLVEPWGLSFASQIHISRMELITCLLSTFLDNTHFNQIWTSVSIDGRFEFTTERKDSILSKVRTSSITSRFSEVGTSVWNVDEGLASYATFFWSNNGH